MSAARHSRRDIDPIRDAWQALGGDEARFWAAIEQAIGPQDKHLTDLERRMYRSGKKIRPLLLLLASRLVQADRGETEVSDKAIRAAVALEMLHVASLIHDDIVDRAESRRGMSSIQAVRGIETAVLIGDLQFIEAIRLFASDVDTANDMRMVRQVLDVGAKLCRGELDEIHDSAPSDAPISELRFRYMRTIDRKTAGLFGLSCEVGASLGRGHRRQIFLLSQYGRYLGKAFQIMDDLFDIAQHAEESGKPAYTDILQRRWTLPILLAVQELGDDHMLSRWMRGHLEREDVDIADLGATVMRTASFQKAYDEARFLAIQAQAHLAPFPEGPMRPVLDRLARYIVDRGFTPAPSPRNPSAMHETTSTPPDLYLQLMLNVLYKLMVNPSSQFYLPRLIQGQSNPTYEPYVIAGTWTVPKSQSLEQAGTNICYSSLPPNYQKMGYQGLASSAPNLTLGDPSIHPGSGAIPFQVSGISNVTPGQPIVTDGETAQATATFSNVPTWPHAAGITVQGNYAIQQPCCASQDGATCLGTTNPWGKMATEFFR